MSDDERVDDERVMMRGLWWLEDERVDDGEDERVEAEGMVE